MAVAQPRFESPLQHRQVSPRFRHSDPTRRGILERLGRGDASISDLADAFAITLTGIKKHVQVLEGAGLVTSEKVGPTRLVRANTAHPLYGAVRQVLLGTYGPPAVVADEFRTIADVDAVLEELGL